MDFWWAVTMIMLVVAPLVGAFVTETGNRVTVAWYAFWLTVYVEVIAWIAYVIIHFAVKYW